MHIVNFLELIFSVNAVKFLYNSYFSKLINQFIHAEKSIYGGKY